MDPQDNPKQIVRVTIFNQIYPVTTSGNPQEIEELARQIDELMSNIARKAGNLDSTRTAVLACLHLADKLRATQRELSGFKESVQLKTRDFALLLDKVMPDEEPGA